MPHTLSAQDLAVNLDLQPATGLPAQEVVKRLARYGINQLPSPSQRRKRQVFVAQFKNVLILILAGASVLSAAIGNVKDAAVILAVMLINASLGFCQEWRA